MRDALRAKFTQHAELKKQLIATGDATIVEHTANGNNFFLTQSQCFYALMWVTSNVQFMHLV